MPLGLEIPLIACASLAASCWVLSVLTRDVSWVDRLWSIAPAGYVLWFAVSVGRFEPRLVLMAVLVGLWGARLTFNFARRGGYGRGGEDYRWDILRGRMSPAAFAVFNVVFICIFQHVLLLALALPAWIAWRLAPAPIRPIDLLAATLFSAFLIGETLADQQQWRFQRDKLARQRRGERIADEAQFASRGWFRYSRHPNFFCEQGLWWAFYLFATGAGGGWLNVSIVGPLGLTVLFQGSTAFTESISRSKYRAYADYQRRTSRLIPWRPRSPEDTLW